jgi:hypothetical protein
MFLSIMSTFIFVIVVLSLLVGLGYIYDNYRRMKSFNSISSLHIQQLNEVNRLYKEKINTLDEMVEMYKKQYDEMLKLNEDLSKLNGELYEQNSRLVDIIRVNEYR